MVITIRHKSNKSFSFDYTNFSTTIFRYKKKVKKKRSIRFDSQANRRFLNMNSKLFMRFHWNMLVVSLDLKLSKI